MWTPPWQRHPKVFICCCVLFWGTLYTMSRKAQFVTKTAGSDGVMRPHHHAMFHTLFMFFGLACCLPVDVYWRATDKTMKPLPKFHPGIMIIPAMCDVVCTAIDSLGLMKTHVSVYQMLRSCLIIFTALISRVVLGHRLTFGQIGGIFCIIIGCVCLGLSNTSKDFAIAEEFAPAPMFGNLMVILGQLLVAIMFVYEEKVMAEYDVPVMQVVGWEGVWGIGASASLLVIFYFMPGEDCGMSFHPGVKRCSFDNTLEAAYEAFGHRIIMAYLLIAAGSIAFFNYFGTKVTQMYSSTYRAMIDCTRMLCVWALTFFFQWETGRKPQSHWLQLVGYGIILVGFVLFSKVMQAKEKGDEEEDAEKASLIGDKGDAGGGASPSKYGSSPDLKGDMQKGGGLAH